MGYGNTNNEIIQIDNKEIQDQINANNDKIGLLSDLKTTDQSSLVNAVNENTSQLAEKSNKVGLSDNTEVYLDKFPIINGEVDDSGRFYRAIQALNGKGTVIFSPREYVIGEKTLTYSESSNVTLIGYGTTIKQAINQYTDSWSLIVNGDNFKIFGITFDGQQESMTDSTYGTGGLALRGKNPYLERVTTKGFNGQGCNLADFEDGEFVNCHFDDNANLGMEINNNAYLKFTNCTWNRNGYGFQKTRTNYADISHGFVAFGLAIRFRSHHLVFVNCDARDNGRDGMNVNQGSYSIKFIGCLAHGNDDGGFTISADSTDITRAGDGESPYDLAYIDCESYNNYASGLVTYTPVYGVQVIGGRYYNNHRLAGNLVDAASYHNGIYFTNGCKDININANTYDDRQSASVTALSNPTFTVNSWITGTINYYPKVAVIGADGTLKGYAKITAETSTSVTLEPTTQNGVTLTSIVVGDMITQAVQKYGVRCDNSCTGKLEVNGFGNLLDNLFVGGYGDNQNLKVINADTDGVELLLNGTFDSDTTLPPTNWTTSTPNGGDQGIETTITKSMKSYKLVAGTSPAESDGGLISDFLPRAKESLLKFSGKVYATGEAGLKLFSVQNTSTFSTYVKTKGNSKWYDVEIWLYCPVETTNIIPRLYCANGTAYFDNLTLKVYNPRYEETGRLQRGLPL